MTVKWQKSPEELIALFYEVMREFPEAELRKMFGYPCAFYQANMFIGLHQSDLILRLPQEVREKALREGLGTLFAPMAGRVMKEYLSVGDRVIKDRSRLRELVALSFEYVQTLPPKLPKKRVAAKALHL